MIPPDTLPMHLMLALMQAGIWNGASHGWSNNSQDWWNVWTPFLPRPRHPLEAQTSALLDQWQSLVAGQSEALKNLLGQNPEFFQALTQESGQQTREFLEGVAAYTSAQYQRPEKKYRVLWQQGSARLLDLAPEAVDAVAVLMVPSLINKFYVLDLYPGASLAEYLAAQGYRPLMLDWGSPGAAEEDFTTGDYITAYAIPALQALRAAHEGPITLAGYCMGGIFAVAMAQLASFLVDGLILLATPWDFAAEDTPRVLLDPSAQTMLRSVIRGMNPVPPIVTQTLFHLINPWHVQKKYAKFLTTTGAARKHFLAVEAWVNDGVPLTQNVAEECFVDWPQGNILARQQWKVGRRWIAPESIPCPALALIPKHDMIVPVGTARPLTRLLARCDVRMPESGHVSMVVGSQARKECWEPVAGWLEEKF